jgi:hypothetical protein
MTTLVLRFLADDTGATAINTASSRPALRLRSSLPSRLSVPT